MNCIPVQLAVNLTDTEQFICKYLNYNVLSESRQAKKKKYPKRRYFFVISM
jgi:hypothetical protein